MLRILIGDDHAVFRRGTKDVLQEHFAPLEVHEAKSGWEMVTLASQGKWDAFIMDVTMPGKSGTDLLEHIRSLHPSTPVLVYSMHSEESYAVRMIRSGASGYLNKSTGLDELVAAMRSILAGQEFINPAVARCLIERMRTKDSGQLHDALSNREFQILRMVAQGESLKQIALTLCVSANTVSTYRTRILQKLRLKTNAELTRYALEHALI
ncbi:MAG: response regulator transcription factor [Nitrospira sp.]|nr:response regulator transcription factor [Nitrospira sp.]MBX3342703.1 response regulator transcription factor [Nitrospira sp.]MBX3371591.1 response regulator transcription factor [Nitrospira sp.]MCW5793773.1 response regulator transcription factor [Nitrospira sp.]